MDLHGICTRFAVFSERQVPEQALLDHETLNDPLTNGFRLVYR